MYRPVIIPYYSKKRGKESVKKFKATLMSPNYYQDAKKSKLFKAVVV